MSGQYITYPNPQNVTVTPSGTQDVNLIKVGGTAFSLGQKVMTSSISVTIASDQSAISITGSVSITGTVTVTGTVAATQSGTWNIATLTTITNPVAVTQSTSPWVVSGTVSISGSVTVTGTVAATQSGTWTVQQGGAPWSVNQTQWNGVAVLTGNGVTGTGSVRVTIASDNTAFSVNAVQSGTWNIGTLTTITNPVAVTQSGSWSLAANQSVNVAQINGVTPLMGNGVTGTGSQRVTIASDNTAFSVNAVQSGTWNIGTVTTVTTVTAVTAITNALPAGTNNIGKVTPNSANTASSPTATSVGVATASAVASNVNRKGLVLVNTSSNTISLGFGASAVLNSGITLSPFGSFTMDAFNFTTATVNAIASAASSNLAIQEFT